MECVSNDSISYKRLFQLNSVVFLQKNLKIFKFEEIGKFDEYFFGKKSFHPLKGVSNKICERKIFRWE